MNLEEKLDKEYEVFFRHFLERAPRDYKLEYTGEQLVRIDKKLYMYLVGVKGKSCRLYYDVETNPLCPMWTDPISVHNEDSIEDSIKYGTVAVENKKEINKIIILGFPHSGTTILRAKMGDCKNAIEICKEIDYVDAVLAQNHKDYQIIAKSINTNHHPFYSGYFDDKNTKLLASENKYTHDCHIVLMTKNPYEVFGSISKRLTPEEVSQANPEESHSFESYENFSKLWLEFRDGHDEQVHCIKYEEMFDNNFEALKKTFTKISLEYDDKVFEGDNFNYSLETLDSLKSKKRPDPKKEPLEYRLWQMNQPFTKMSNPDAYKDIHPELLERIKNSEVIKELGYLPPE
jgi:hypothetical protein